MQVISSNNNFASGAKRLMAFFIDRLLLHALFSVILFNWWWGSPIWWWHNDYDFSTFHLGFKFWEYNFIVEAIIVLYYAFMESSKYQATIGKLVLGMKVTDTRNEPINFPRALLRNLSKYLSGLILGIGYIMIIFDDRKQGLHDKIADTLVVNQ